MLEKKPVKAVEYLYVWENPRATGFENRMKENAVIPDHGADRCHASLWIFSVLFEL